MKPIRNHKLIVFGCLIAATAAAHAGTSAADAAAIFEAKRRAAFSLTSKSVGIWGGVPWVTPIDHLSSGFNARVKDFDFGIKAIRVTPTTDPATLATSLDEINQGIAAGEKTAPAKREILEIDFWDGNDRFRATPPPNSPLVYEKRFKMILDKVNWKSPTVIGITVSEENVPISNGRAAILQAMYGYCHAHYPGIFVFQWYSPNTSLPVPYQGIDIQADGWIINPYTICPEMYPDPKYHLTADPYDYVLRQYIATGKPVVDMMYASDEYASWYNPNDPKNTYKVNEWTIMEHEFLTNRKYNIPTAFYWEEYTPATHSGSTTFDLANPPSPLMAQINTKVLSYVTRAHTGT